MNLDSGETAHGPLAAPPIPLETRNWYAVYTQPRHEQAVNRHLAARSVETYLPVLSTVSRWKDRSVTIDTPVFPGYVFTRIEPAQRMRVITVPGVVRVLSFHGEPAAIADCEIEAVKLVLARGTAPKPHPFLAVGERVRVKSGTFEGLEGLIVRRGNECRLVVSVALINHSLSMEIDEDSLEPLRIA